MLRLVGEIQVNMDFERPLMKEELEELRLHIDAVLTEVDELASSSPFLVAFRELVQVGDESSLGRGWVGGGCVDVTIQLAVVWVGSRAHVGR